MEKKKNREADPSAENLLLYIRNAFAGQLPAAVSLTRIKFFETTDTIAEWLNVARTPAQDVSNGGNRGNL